MEFFAKAAPKEVVFPVQPPPQADTMKPLLMRIMSNPANSLEHIEKQQRSLTPSEAPKQQQQQPHHQQHQHQQQQQQNQQQQKNHHQQQQQQQHQQQQPPPPHQPMPIMMMPSPVSSVPVIYGTPPSVSALPTVADIERSKAEQPALLPPTMFTSGSQETVRWQVIKKCYTCLKKLSFYSFVLSIFAKIVDSIDLFHSKVEIILTFLFQVGGDVSPRESTPKTETFRPEPLTRNQLLQSVSYLIKHDPEFITKLHEAYVKSFNEML
jgi:mRNA-decapping enzyme 1B